MVERTRLAAWALVGVGGLLVVVVPELIAETVSREVLLGLSVVGGSLLWAGAIWDDSYCRARRDERQALIHYQAGYVTMLAFMAMLGTAVFVAANLDADVSADVVMSVLAASLVVYFGAVAYLRRSM